MRRTARRTFDLGEMQTIWVRPNEDCTLWMDFGMDVSGWTFALYYAEHKWPYMPNSYEEIGPGTITTGFTFTTNETLVAGAVVNLTIDEATINNWVNRKMDIRLQVNDGTNTWVSADRTLTVAQGD